MQYTLKNEFILATITSKGAELCKLTDREGTDYLWSADPTYWSRHAPLLFPFVGRLADGTYTFKDTTYTATQHGFARDMTFSLTEETDTSITLTLLSDEKTSLLYPFHFRLDITYLLKGKSLEIIYQVTNQDTQTIGFKIGAHPGFMCPFFESETMEDYYLEFEKQEAATIVKLSPNGLFSTDTEPFSGKVIPLSTDLFAHDAIVLTDLESHSISLCSSKHNKKLTLDFTGFPFLAIWSLATPSPFVCIEPWFGHGDFTNDSKDLLEKKDIVKLSPSDIFECKHVISLS